MCYSNFLSESTIICGDRTRVISPPIYVTPTNQRSAKISCIQVLRCWFPATVYTDSVIDNNFASGTFGYCNLTSLISSLSWVGDPRLRKFLTQYSVRHSDICNQPYCSPSTYCSNKEHDLYIDAPSSTPLSSVSFTKELHYIQWLLNVSDLL